MAQALEPRRQAPHHAPDEPKVQLLALRDQGYSMAAASELVGVCERTGWNWWNRCREVARNQEIPEIQDGWVRVVRRAQGVQHAVLDVMEDVASVYHDEDATKDARLLAGRTLLKHAAMPNFYAGTGTDKLQKDSTPQVNAQNVLIVVNAAKPDTIDVESEVVDG